MTVGAVDETGQEKAGSATAGVKRQYMGCAGRVANGINTVHLSYVREGTGHALIGARQWIPREQIADPVESLVTGLPLDLGFRTKGQLAIDICTDAYADGHQFRFHLRGRGLRQLHPAAGVLRGRGPGLRAAGRLELHGHAARRDEADLRRGGQAAGEGQAALGGPLRRQGSKGERWYAWAWIATASPRHRLLVRRHLKTGELAFHYCYVPEGQLLTKTRLIRAAGLRWPARRISGSARTASAWTSRRSGSTPRSCATSCSSWPPWRSAPSPPPCSATAPTPRPRPRSRPISRPRPNPGMIPLTIPEIKRLLAALTTRPLPPWHVIHWDAWTRRHQARSRWFHKRTRLERDTEIALVS